MKNTKQYKIKLVRARKAKKRRKKYHLEEYVKEEGSERWI